MTRVALDFAEQRLKCLLSPFQDLEKLQAVKQQNAEGFLIVTAAADRGLVDIHDRRPLVLAPEAAREWMRQDVTGAEAAEIARDGAVSADDFTWHPVTRAVGNVKNQGPELLAPLSP